LLDKKKDRREARKQFVLKKPSFAPFLCLFCSLELRSRSLSLENNKTEEKTIFFSLSQPKKKLYKLSPF